MSQSQRQEELALPNSERRPSGAAQSPNNPSRSVPSLRGPSRGQVAQSPLSNSLIPRDYLGTRPDASSLRERKPSPLQSSHTTPISSPPHNTQDSMPSKTNTYIVQPIPEVNVKAVLQNSTVDGSLNGRMTAQNHSPTSAGSAIAEVLPRTRPTMANRTYQTQVPQSPPDSPASTSSFQSERQHLPTGMPRNSSLDSAISSITSPAHQAANSSADPGNVSPTEIQSLISTAGSPENLIAYLIKEKQHAASQNAQLWKLVDKQRSLLLGLNKDLEQLSKDKERYKKKLKELQNQTPPVPSTAVQQERPTTAPPVAESAIVTPGKSFAKDVIEDSRATLRTPDNKIRAQLESSLVDPSMMPSPLHTLQPQGTQELEHPGDLQQTPPQLQFTEASSAMPHAMAAQSDFTTSVQQLEHVRQAQVPSQPRDTGGSLQRLDVTPSFNFIEPSPLAEKPDKAFPVAKRVKPAPLNLNQANRGSMLLHNLTPGDHSGSDYEETPPADRNRGRKKTREEDDRERERELLAQKQQEPRSQSNQTETSESVQKLQEDEVNEAVMKPVGLPLKPRPKFKQSPSAEKIDRLAPPQNVGTGSQIHHDGDSSIQRQEDSARPLSPGLPVSPRPADRPLGSPLPRMSNDRGLLNALPLSPRALTAGFPLSPRAPKQSISVPINGPLSAAFPPPPGGTLLSLQRDQLETLSHMSPPPSYISHQNNHLNSQSPGEPPQIYRGYVDANYPDLMLPPNALPSVFVQTAFPRLRPSRHSYVGGKSQEDAPVFVISVFSRFDRKELWRAEKVILSLSQLDQQFRAVTMSNAKLPDRKLFASHSPAMVDARRAALDAYFGDLLDTHMTEKGALVICKFLSTDVIEPGTPESNPLKEPQQGISAHILGPDGRPRKEGYLTKRGKNFGGWKTRFFILHGPEFRYFEAPGGAHLGTIKLQNAQIGKQTSSDSPSQNEEESENQYRHAFLILEPKRKDSSSLVKHVLCAESDRERDEWVDVLLHYVDDESEDEKAVKAPSRRFEDGKSHITGFESKMKRYAPAFAQPEKDDPAPNHNRNESLKSINYADTMAGTAPAMRAAGLEKYEDGTPSPTSTSSHSTAHRGENDPLASSLAYKNISAPVNGGVIQDAEAWGNKSIPAHAKQKRGLWNFRQKSASDLLTQSQSQHLEAIASNGQNGIAADPREPIRAVFGLPLAEAVELCPPMGVDVKLPAVVYRCIEYLRAKKAANEEGLFRLSGSNLVVRTLKERFNTEGDVDFLADDQYYDVHAVASLFKSYLRELPSTVLTKELHIEFIAVLEMEDRKGKVAAFNTLVHRLPEVNFALLRALSQYLLEVVNNSERNKMNVRNVGIVFSPTLNIPAPVFSMFLTEFNAIFVEAAKVEPQTRSVEVKVPAELSPEDVRSPRHQMFSDIPTPAYHDSFPNGTAPGSYDMSTHGYSQSTLAGINSAQDVGFIPMQPSYDTRYLGPTPRGQPAQQQQRYPPSQHGPQQAEYGSLNMMISPENAPNLKAKRRESSMLFLGS